MDPLFGLGGGGYPQPSISSARTAPAPSAEDLRIRDTARNFEAAMVATMVESMMVTGKVETFGGGHAEEMWRSFQARAIADQIAAQGGIGLARSVETAMRSYGAAPAPRPEIPPLSEARGSGHPETAADPGISGAR
jgi:peptidoglycan hydrolase FlgJ